MQNLKDWLSYMPAFMDLVGVVNFRIIVVEQTQNGHWNKGILYNRGYLPTPHTPPSLYLSPSLSTIAPLSLPTTACVCRGSSLCMCTSLERAATMRTMTYADYHQSTIAYAHYHLLACYMRCRRWMRSRGVRHTGRRRMRSSGVWPGMPSYVCL